MALKNSVGGMVALILAGAGFHALGCSSSVSTGSGGSGGSGAGGAGSGGGGGQVVPAVCKNPKPYPNGDHPSGYVLCESGAIHRTDVVTCHSDLPRTTTCDDGSGGGVTSGCTVDADCTDQPNGYCRAGEAEPGCYCSYGCLQDADCGKDQICVCGAPVGYCAPADCTSDDGCSEGQLCATFISEPGCGFAKFACTTPADQCQGDNDCTSGDECGMKDGHRQCLPPECAIGRPFLVEEAPRVAATVRRADWANAGALPDVEALDVETRRALAEHWTRAGQMEHASIAAFARFVLDLLALGAPPELVARANAAMVDETRHAETCFAFASAYAGVDVGPGPLAIEGALTGRGAREIVMTAIVEGCIGETVAAFEAARSAEAAIDPVLREALAGIAVDEARHAELAWDFVAWALARFPALEAEARALFAAPLAKSPEGPALESAGVLSGARRDAVRAEALEAAVLPLRELLAA